jgi:hypothetical protein
VIKFPLFAFGVLAAAMVFAAPVHADSDIDAKFKNKL